MFEETKKLASKQPWKCEEDFKQMQAKAKKLANLGMNQYEINAHLWATTGQEIEERVIFETAEQAVIENTKECT
jgi:DNA-binding ferritin-like protein (Dps family)